MLVHPFSLCHWAMPGVCGRYDKSSFPNIGPFCALDALVCPFTSLHMVCLLTFVLTASCAFSSRFFASGFLLPQSFLAPLLSSQ